MSAVSKLDVVCPTAWHGQAVPERQWLIPGILLRGTVTILSGDGGVGKSLLAQQLVTAMALGQPFLGIAPNAEPVKSLAIFCEDSIEELHYRQDRINAHYRCAMADLGAMTLLSRVAQDNALMTFKYDHGIETPFYHQVEHQIRETGAELAIFDTAADTFEGNENVRIQVRQFIAAIRRLAMINNGGALVQLHPSLSGLSNGSGMSGNTAWHNSVRGRLYLTRPKSADGEEDQQSDRRTLKLMKSNYGRMGDELRLVWRDHVFVREDDGRSTSNMVDRLDLDVAVMAGLRKLVANGALLAADPNASSGFANKVRKLPSCRLWTREAVFAAQERLIALGKIVKVEMGPPSKRRVYVRPHDMRLPGEVDVGNAGA